MSLDVHLDLPGVSANGTGIFIRENGANRELTRAEWDEKFPGREPLVVQMEGRCAYSANITHNLGKMADKAGVYEALWRPEEVGITYAYQLIEPLEIGLAKLKANPTYYNVFNPENGWGNYDGLIEFIDQYLAACKQYQQAEVRVSR